MGLKMLSFDKQSWAVTALINKTKQKKTHRGSDNWQ